MLESNETTLAVSDVSVDIDSQSGTIRIDGALITSGADYAEYFKSKLNDVPDDGSILVLDGDAVRYAISSDEEILGVSSVAPGVVGNEEPFAWKHRYLKDIWGRYIKDSIDWVRFTTRVGHEQIDYNGPVHRAPVEPPGDAVYSQQEHYVQNPAFDPQRPYSPRSERSHDYTLVSLLGQVHVRVFDNIPPGHYVNALGRPSASITRLRVMRMITSYDAIKGYGIALCLLREPLEESEENFT